MDDYKVFFFAIQWIVAHESRIIQKILVKFWKRKIASIKSIFTSKAIVWIVNSEISLHLKRRFYSTSVTPNVILSRNFHKSFSVLNEVRENLCKSVEIAQLYSRLHTWAVNGYYRASSWLLPECRRQPLRSSHLNFSCIVLCTLSVIQIL